MSIEAPPRPSLGDQFPSENEFQSLLSSRKRKGLAARLVFLTALTIAVLALLTLLYTIINDSFGLVAVVNERNPEDVVADLGFDPETTSLSDLSREDLLVVAPVRDTARKGRKRPCSFLTPARPQPDEATKRKTPARLRRSRPPCGTGQDAKHAMRPAGPSSDLPPCPVPCSSPHPITAS